MPLVWKCPPWMNILLSSNRGPLFQLSHNQWLFLCSIFLIKTTYLWDKAQTTNFGHLILRSEFDSLHCKILNFFFDLGIRKYKHMKKPVLKMPTGTSWNNQFSVEILVHCFAFHYWCSRTVVFCEGQVAFMTHNNILKTKREKERKKEGLSKGKFTWLSDC